MLRLSIIIPFYNVEKYIAECLDSVFDQDIPLEEYEVICVNDGSPDHSREIVLDYMKRYPNLRLVEHDHNRKLGAARNTGRAAAKGRYIWNVDSDDKIAPRCLKHILEVCETRDLDMLEMCYTNWRENGDNDSTSLYQKQRDGALYSGLEYLAKYHLQYMGGICSIWRKVFKRSFLDDNDIFSPPINMGEDEPFAILTFCLAKRVAYLDRDYYFYRRIEQSLSGENRQSWSGAKWYEASLVCGRYMHVAYKRVCKMCPNTVRQKIREMIAYETTLWISMPINSDVSHDFWTLCRKDFWKNIYVFNYLGKRNILRYLKHIL